MNRLQEELVDILEAKTGVKNGRLFFRVLVAYKFAQMATMMRTNIEFAGSKNIPTNIYALNLANSGFSKGKSVNILEDEIFGNFRKTFTYDVYERIKEDNLAIEAGDLAIRMSIDISEAMKIVRKQYDAGAKFSYAFPLSTIEGLRSLRQKYAIAGIGSTCMETDEIGSVLTSQTMMETLGLCLETYDMGKGKQKVTKTDSSPEMLKAVPSNLLFFGTPTKLMDGDGTEEAFVNLLETGYARRMIFGYIKNFETESELSPEELYNQLTSSTTEAGMIMLASHFESLADVNQYNRTLTTPKDVAIRLLAYQQQCQARARDMKDHQSIQKAELEHRYWKVLKLAGAYAFVDGLPDITEECINDAIELVEQSGEAFVELMNREKPYVRLASYIADIGRKITQVELIEDLPFYRGSESQKRELMNLAVAYGYQNGIIIKKTIGDGIEFYQGSKLEQTNLEKLILSYSTQLADDYKPVNNRATRWEHLYELTTYPTGMNYCSHYFEDGHRTSDKAKPEFNLLILDVDKGLNIDTCKTLLKDYKFLISTTKRHSESEHRYRIILPMSHVLKMTHEEYKEFMKNVFAWLPFEVDEQTSDIARKWETHKGEYHYNEGMLFPAMNFIPNTKKHIEVKASLESYGSLDALQRWFAMNIGEGSRNNMIHKYAMALLDKGLDIDSIRYSIEDMNGKLEKPLPMKELDSTVMFSVLKEATKRGM